MKQDAVFFVGDVPLPMDILVKPGDPLVFSGIWTGRWDSVRNHMLVIEGVDQDGVLDIIYAVGDGPFPLALLHHGSTGAGLTPNLFDLVWCNDWLADSLNAKGWIVACPQRRGRGGSDGLYNEGFCEDRRKGYSPKASIALLGAERALIDANAVLFALLRRPDVARGRVLVGGESRGGVVALLQAGVLEGGVAGVLNFVGGWVGEHWGDREINPTLFKRIGGYRGPVLSIYGRDDPFYSVAHSRSNLAEPDARGVTHQLEFVSVPGNQTGHWAMWSPHLWEEEMEAFLEGIT